MKYGAWMRLDNCDKKRSQFSYFQCFDLKSDIRRYYVWNSNEACNIFNVVLENNMAPLWQFGNHIFFSQLQILGIFLFCDRSPPGLFPPVDLLLEYWIEHVIIGHFYIKFIVSSRLYIFFRGVPVFATYCPCGAWCRGLTTCPLYVSPRFRNWF